MARSKESYQAGADKTNLVKWSKAISKANENKPVFEVIGVEESAWNDMSVKDKLSLIHTYKQDKNIHQERTKKKTTEIKDINYKSLAFKLIQPDLSPEQREKVTQTLTIYQAYESANKELEAASTALKAAQKTYEDAKAKFKVAKEEYDEVNI